jgi:molybdate transport system substrate-binding protein
VTASGVEASDACRGSVWPRLTRGGATGLLAVTVAFDEAAMAWGQGDRVRLHAAGSLRAALTEVARDFTAASGVRVDLVFGASGLLRERLERGEPGDVFASANMEHPEALARAGKAGPVVLFARNRLCALARPEVRVTEGTLLDRMLDPAVTLGTSTPRADPSGDYAREVFRRAEALRPGSHARLEARARRLVGGPTSSPPPADRSVYVQLLVAGEADVFLTYCTNAAQAVRELPSLRVVPLRAPLAVGADYGLTVLTAAHAERAGRLVSFILSPEGQAILTRHGFAAPTGPGG